MDCLFYSASHCLNLHESDSSFLHLIFQTDGHGDYDCMIFAVLFIKSILIMGNQMITRMVSWSSGFSVGIFLIEIIIC